MSKIKLTGSNSGYVEIDSAADAGNLTLALPTAGTALLSNAGNVFSGITTFTGVNITDDITFNGASYNVLWDKSDNQLEFGANAKLSFGGSSDMQIYHDGNHSYIDDSGTGNLRLRSGTLEVTNLASSKTSAIFSSGGGQTLNFNNSTKFVTTNTGAVVTGICTATSFSGSSVGLTYDSPLSHRNFFINGSTIVWQRGTVNPNVGNYGCDRWWFANSATRVDRSTTTPDGFAYSMKVTSSGGTTSIGQAIELIDTGRSQFEPFTKPYTLSFYARTDSGTNDISANVYYRNSKFSATNQTNWNGSAGNNSQWDMGTMTTTWQRFSKTFTTGGNPNANNQILAIEFNNSATYYITGIQFEKGAAATPFEHRSRGDELARCQRYCVVIGADQEMHLGTAHAYNSTNINLSMHVPVAMRVKPTASVVLATSGSDANKWLQAYMGATGVKSNASVSVSDCSEGHAQMRLYLQNAHSGLSVGQALWTHTLPDAKLILDAEL